MAQKKAHTDEELLAELDAIGGTPSKGAAKPKTAAANALKDDDPLAELESLAARKPISRPNTPKLSSSNAAAASSRTRSPVRREVHTPPSTSSARNSEDKARGPLSRKSGESTRSFHQGLTPTSEEERAEEERLREQQTEQSGGWWGGILSTATAAVKQAEAAYKEIQKNEEAQKWAQQVKGNVEVIRGLGM
jgi:hypothetical protein